MEISADVGPPDKHDGELFFVLQFVADRGVEKVAVGVVPCVEVVHGFHWWWGEGGVAGRCGALVGVEGVLDYGIMDAIFGGEGGRGGFELTKFVMTMIYEKFSSSFFWFIPPALVTNT